MDLGIAGKWALVGGASRGLGRGCAQALAREGVHVVMVARTAQPLEQAAHDIARLAPDGVQLHTIAADITTPQGREAIFAYRKDFDIVVTNAGGPPPGDFRDWDREAWIRALDANMLTPIALIHATVDGMARRGFGRIVNITSSAVKAPIDVLGLSNGARSGLTGFVAGLARNHALASRGVTFNNLLPGSFDTDRIRGMLETAAQNEKRSVQEIRHERQRMIAAGRFGTPEEFGQVCAFLCSMQAGYLNGQNILLDGGAYPGTF